MVLDEKMDHGPLLAQELIDIREWPVSGLFLDKILADAGAKLLVDTIPKYIAGEIKPFPQDHDKATFCKNLNKADGLIHLDNDSYKNFLKVCAFDGWPGTFFFAQKKDKKIRVKIASARYENGKMIIERVIPEGKKRDGLRKLPKRPLS
jgi:methionyl-tRNA formyltransferase